MRLAELFQPENERALAELCLKYYELSNVYYKVNKLPPPKEMAAKLNLHDDEYSEFLIFLNDGGYQSILDQKIQDDWNNGAISIQGEPWS